MGIGHTYQEALYKAVVAAHLTVPSHGNVLITVSDRDKPETAELARGFVNLGYRLICTSGTGSYFRTLEFRLKSSRRSMKRAKTAKSI